MPRLTGTFRISGSGGEEVRSFVPVALPPSDPEMVLDQRLVELHGEAMAALSRLGVAGMMVPSAEWFVYGFVRKEALISSEIEGTQATLQDVVTFEATKQAERPDDVRDVCNYVDALEYARKQVASPKGLPISTRLLCQAHKRLMRGVRGGDKQPGEVRRSQNWIGGSRPGNARFVPPPPEMVPELMASLEKWIHAEDPLPPLIRAGLAHVQFETIHPFLDGNGRIGRLLITLLLEHWGLLQSPMLYLSLALKRRQSLYYARLSGIRETGDWEAWTAFYLECVREAADDGVRVARGVHQLLGRDRARLMSHAKSSVSAIRLFDLLAANPVVTMSRAMDLVQVSKPTALRALDLLVDAGVLKETTGKLRDRLYAYQAYLDVLTQ